jgi:hypothetical protein
VRVGGSPLCGPAFPSWGATVGVKLGVLMHGDRGQRRCVPVRKRWVADLQKRPIRHIVTYQPIVSDCFGCEDNRRLCMPRSDMICVRHVLRWWCVTSAG